MLKSIGLGLVVFVLEIHCRRLRAFRFLSDVVLIFTRERKREKRVYRGERVCVLADNSPDLSVLHCLSEKENRKITRRFIFSGTFVRAKEHIFI